MVKKLRNFTLVWHRTDGVTGQVEYRATNAQRARILFMSEHPEMVEVTVLGRSAQKHAPSFYEIGLAILTTNIHMNGISDDVQGAS